MQKIPVSFIEAVSAVEQHLAFRHTIERIIFRSKFLEPNFWLERWENNQIGFHLDKPNDLLEHHWPSLGAEPDATVLVPLCGKTHDLIWLRSRGHAVIGIELSPMAVEQFFAEQGLQPVKRQHGALECWEADGLAIFCGDLFALEASALPPIGAVYDRAALIALPDDMQIRYVAHLQALIPRPAPRLLITVEYDQSEAAGPPFSTDRERVEKIFGADFRIELLESRNGFDDSPSLRDRGLSVLTEHALALWPKA